MPLQMCLFLFSTTEAKNTKKMFEKIQVNVEGMVVMFKRSKFFLSVASKQSYEDGFKFTENNIVQYLAELEEHICSLITYTAFKRDDPHAAIKAIPMESLNQKDHDKRELNVSAEWVSESLTIFRLFRFKRQRQETSKCLTRLPGRKTRRYQAKNLTF